MGSIRLAVRVLARSPAFTLTVTLVLALAIGVNGAAFSLVSSLFLRPLPVEAPERLVRLYTTYDRGPQYFTLSQADYEDLRDLAHVFSGVLADRPAPLSLTMNGPAERIWGFLVSSNYFAVLGVQPAMGRFFRSELSDDRMADEVIVSHGFWQRRLGADPGAIGESILLNGRPFTIVGVAPPGLHGTNVGLTGDLWAPLTADRLAPVTGTERRGSRGYFVVGRLQPGVTLEQARAAARLLARRLQEAYPATNRGITFTVLPESAGGLHPYVRERFLGASAALLMVVGVVLVIACTNVAGLLLARAAMRRREIAVRLALGASRLQIVRQLLVECVMLWLAGGAVGVAVAMAILRLAGSIDLPTDRPVFIDAHLDARVLAYSIALTLVTAIAFGLAPASAAVKEDLIDALRDYGRAPGFRSPARSALIAGEIALCLVLLVGAALCLRSLANVHRIDLGFDPEGVVIAGIDLSAPAYDEARRREAVTRLLTRLRSTAGVDSVGVASRIPFELNITRTAVAADAADPGISVDFAVVNATYFETLRIMLRDGRAFDDADARASPRVIVNQRLAGLLWPDRRAVGQTLFIGHRPREVVGVVQDGKYLTLGEEPAPFVYFAYEQAGGSALTVLVRASGYPATVLARVREEARAIAAAAPLYNVRTMKEHLAIARAPASGAAMLLGAFGMLALLLASVGLYGLLAFAVGQRTREIGIRRALGAGDRALVALVVRQAMRPVAVGLVAGLAFALLALPALRGLLYGIGPFDPFAYAVAAATLLLCGAAASWLPARRATRMEPTIALRHE
jgi:predicted permease